MFNIHHLNCSTFCPPGGHLMDGVTSGIREARLVCHCLLLESDHGLILVDTGLGTRDVEASHSRMSPFFLKLLRPRLALEETAVAQIRLLGFDPRDVRHIILTHLDFDHAGGLDDFPEAKVHLLRPEMEAIEKRNSLISRGRYRPEQLTHRAEWRAYLPGGERWFGFEAVHDLEGLPPEILLVPLIGHTLGHSGVAIRTDHGWLLHCGDAYFYHGEMDPQRPHCTPGLKGYQIMMDTDHRLRVQNQQRLRELVKLNSPEVRVFSAHDPTEFMALAQQKEHLWRARPFPETEMRPE